MKVVVNRKALEKALDRRDLSHEELAAKIGTTQSHLSSIIRGRVNVSCNFRAKLLECLKEYSFDDLFIFMEDERDEGDQ